MRMIDWFDRWVATHPDTLFAVQDNTTATYSEADRLSRRLANRLIRNGAGPGARVVVLCRNSVQHCIAILAVLRTGSTWTSVGAAEPNAGALDRVRELAGRIVIYDRDREDELATLTGNGPSVWAPLRGGDLAALEEDLSQESDQAPAPAWTPDDVVTLFASGGSSGRPKGVLASHRIWAAGMPNRVAMLPYAKPIQAMTLPMHYSAAGGGFMFNLFRGGTLVLLERFDPEKYLRTIAQHRVMSMFLAPTALAILLSYPGSRDFDVSSLRTLLVGGAPMAASGVEAAMDWFGPALCTAYGQTETVVSVSAMSGVQYAALRNEGAWDRLKSCGQALPASLVEVMGENGQLLQPGQVGELVVRGQHLMLGYADESDDERRKRRESWHLTRDMGYKDDLGFLYIVGRKDDLIISRGQNIYPAEVEAVLSAYPGVVECAVVGVPDPVLGELALAVVTTGAPMQGADLLAHCASALGRMKTPAAAYVWTEIPKLPSGKIDKLEIRRRLSDR